MKLTKELARKIRFFHLIDPGELDGVEEYAEWLEAILHGPCSIWEKDNGELVLVEVRQLVERVNGLKIEIYANEHPPPHFLVKSPNVNAIFSIEDCDKLQGHTNANDYHKIRFWHKSAKHLLISVWNETRPTSCCVGAYKAT